MIRGKRKAIDLVVEFSFQLFSFTSVLLPYSPISPMLLILSEILFAVGCLGVLLLSEGERVTN